MKKYIELYKRQAYSFINSAEKRTSPECEKFLKEFEMKISYFQHERLIHLIVTVLFALLEMSAIYVVMIAPSIGALIFSVLFLVLLVPYVMHYYFLENSVQEMYRMRDTLIEQMEQLPDKA